MAIVEHTHWKRCVRTSCKTKRPHNTFISLNQPISNMCLPHGCSEHLCEFVFLKTNVGHNQRRSLRVRKKGTHIMKWEVADTRLTCFLSAQFLIPHSLPWGTCTLSWRGHIWLLSTLLLRKKVCFLLCLISGVLSSDGGKKSVRFGNEFCAMLEEKASQRSEIKAEEVKLKTVILQTIIMLQEHERKCSSQADVLIGKSVQGWVEQINHADFYTPMTNINCCGGGKAWRDGGFTHNAVFSNIQSNVVIHK